MTGGKLPQEANLAAGLVGGLTEKLAELERAVRRQAERFAEVMSIGAALASAQDVDALLELVMGRMTALLSADAATLFMLDASRQEVWSRVLVNSSLEEIRLPVGTGIVGHVVASGESVLLGNAYEDARFHPGVDLKSGFVTASLIAAPLRHVSGRILGAVEVLHRQPQAFTLEDRVLVEAIATQIAAVLDNVLLYAELRSQNAQLIEAQRELDVKARLEDLGQALSGVVHDFRTPMTIISGYSQLLAAEDDPKERVRLAEVVDLQVDQLNTMMKETLAFARGERELLLRPVDFPRFLTEVEGFLHQEFSQSGVKLVIEPSYQGAARVDEGKLKRVIYNLARNALQAMPDGGCFWLRVEQQADALVFNFRDDGPGIPEAILGTLFESFVTHGKPGGTGLGLAIVKKMVDEHGGTVRCDSEPGRGTRFEVRVPAGLPSGDGEGSTPRPVLRLS